MACIQPRVILIAAILFSELQSLHDSFQCFCCTEFILLSSRSTTDANSSNSTATSIYREPALHDNDAVDMIEFRSYISSVVTKLS